MFAHMPESMCCSGSVSTTSSTSSSHCSFSISPSCLGESWQSMPCITGLMTSVRHGSNQKPCCKPQYDPTETPPRSALQNTAVWHCQAISQAGPFSTKPSMHTQPVEKKGHFRHLLYHLQIPHQHRGLSCSGRGLLGKQSQ